MTNRFWRWLPPLLWGLLLAFLSLMPAGTAGLSLFGIPYIDKVAHFGMYAVWAFLVIYALVGTTHFSGTKRLWLVFFLSSVAGVLFEYAQSAMTYGRSLEAWDMIANSLGALAGSLAGNFWFGRGVKNE